MAKKVTKNTLGSKYAEILSRKGINMNDCTVLCFKFPTISQVNVFHFKLLAKHLNYHLFDGATEIVNIIIDKTDTDTKELITTIAEKYEGEKSIAKLG